MNGSSTNQPTYDTDTLACIHASIRHWVNMWKRWDCRERPRASDCALCQQFLVGYDCSDCPIELKTGKPLCQGTPYRKASAAWDRLDEIVTEGDHPTAAQIEAWQDAADDMIDFLADLLPLEEQRKIEPFGEWPSVWVAPVVRREKAARKEDKQCT